MKKMAVLSLTAGLLSASTLALATPDPEDAIDYRQGIFTAIYWNFGPMGDMMKGKLDWDGKDFSRRAANVATLSTMPLEGFIPGSYSDDDSDALPAIEKNWDDFTERMTAFQESAAVLAEAAKSGDKASIAPAFMDVAKSCKGCHDNFKD